MKAPAYNQTRSELSTARDLRLKLPRCMAQSDVAKFMGMSRRAVDRVEITALAKVCWLLRAEREELAR